MATDLVRTLPPGVLFTPAQARTRARLASGMSDDEVAELVDAATRTIERELRRQFMVAEWRQTLDGFPDDGVINLLLAPIIGATVEYLDDDGEWQETECRLLIGEPSRVLPPLFEEWPTPTEAPGNVRVNFVAGYGVGDQAANVPADLKRAVLMLVSHYHENPQAVVAGSDARTFEIPLGVQDLIDLHRWTGFF